MKTERRVLEGWSLGSSVASCLFVWTAACGVEQTIDIRYRSEAIRRSITEIEAYHFGEDGGKAAPSCEQLDPRGLGPGDAEARTGFVAKTKSKGPPREDIAEIAELSRAQSHTLVIEGWGPACKNVSSGDEPSCAQFATDGPRVLRGYACIPLELENAKSEVTIDLESFAQIGATMSVPNLTPPSKAVHYDADHPLPVVNGVEALDRFLVQLLDQSNEAANDVKVHFGITAGSGSFDQEATLSRVDDAIGDGGFAQAVLRAGVNASRENGAKIAATAYAPGYEGAPIVFEARAVPAVEIDITSMSAPKTEHSMREMDPEFRPVVVDDFDGNGRADVAFATGFIGSCNIDPEHQLVVLYQEDGGTFTARVSPSFSGEMRGLAPVRLHSHGFPTLLTFLSDSCSTLQEVDESIPGISNPRTYVVRNPRLGLWAGLDAVDPGPTISTVPSVLSELLRCDGADCTNVPITQAVVAASPADIDGDGIEEIAATRCSYVYFAPRVSGEPVPQASRVNCHGDLADRSDSQIVLLSAEYENGELTGFRERAAIEEAGGDGGFREVELRDINGDQSPDLVFATQTEVGAICGRRNMPETGYGFGQVPPPPRSDASITFAQGYSVRTGNFDGDGIADVVATGGLRAASPNAGVKMNPSEGCSFGQGDDAVIIGPKTYARRLLVRVADLNLDGFDDVLALHRDTHELTTLFGNGTNTLAKGPVIQLPGGPSAELGLFVESKGGPSQVAVAATVSSDDGRVFVLRIRPIP
jgi:hypothetical protein